jgi:acetoin utilization deacetylase AcuC-like enzyme
VPRVGLYDHPTFREHDSGPGHPETPERLDALREGIRGAQLEQRLELLSPRPATREELTRAHGEGHVARVASTEGQTQRLDADTQAGPRSYAAAVLAAGAVIDAVERVLADRLDRAFCAVRPPGHHAEANRAMGFCLFNNVAVGAAHALAQGVGRVLIVDWDVHHGNGTQAIFLEDPRVLYVSSHAFPWYPGTGALSECGVGPGRGFTVNLPMPPGMKDGDYARVYREIVEPIGRAFDPELVLVSAGFDAAAGDPLAGMELTEQGFGELTDVCLGLAEGTAKGRAVFVFEGGYGLSAISRGGAGLVGRLLGEPHERVAASHSPRTDRLLEAYRRQLAPFWSVLEA